MAAGRRRPDRGPPGTKHSGDRHSGTPRGVRAAAGTLVINGKAQHWLSQGFPWVYPDEVLAGAARPGEFVALADAAGRVVGRGISDTGRLAARVFRHDDGPIDAAWFDAAVARAVALRRRAVWRPDTNASRLIHGENDGLPGIRVDLWRDLATITLDGPALAPCLDDLGRALRDHVPVRAAWLCYRPDPRDDADSSAFLPRPGRLWGSEPDDVEIEVVERGVRLAVRPGEGPDPGVYCDMRDVRAWLAPHWADRRVLNLFAYTGAFSAAALVGGAAHVTTVDLSAPYLARSVDNVARNGCGADRHNAVEDDAFRALDRMRRASESVDIVVCDPPSFSHGPAGTWSAAQDTPRLVAACARVLAPGGWLVFASNHGQTSPRKFRGAVHDGLRKARRFARELTFLGTPPDFPADIGFPEAHYLKVGVWSLD